MKLHRIIYVIMIPALIGISLDRASAQKVNKQESSKEDKIQNLVQSGRYVFIARTVLPMSGRVRQLTTAYDLSVTPDTIHAYLPYFGRAYTAPMDPSEGGIRFTSTKFRYNITDAQKGGWNISIEPQDVRDPQKLTINISSGGSASLHVISNRRQAISFNGIIKEKKE